MTSFVIQYQNQQYSCRHNETLLEAFHRQGVEVNFSCRKGSCQVCMMRCVSGEIPLDARRGLRPEYQAQGFFLPCSCYPVGNMAVAEIPRQSLFNTGVIYKKEMVSTEICRLLIEPPEQLDYIPGQYFNLRRTSDGLARSYSIVSHPEDFFLEFHIKKMTNGQMSSWIIDELAVGDAIDIQGPMGSCHYGQVNSKNMPIVLAGSGTGLAPLIGIAKDALRQEHRGNIYIYHGGRSESDIYLQHEFTELALKHKNLFYVPCVDGARDGHIEPHWVHDVVDSEIGKLFHPFVFLAGSPDFVNSMQPVLKWHGIPADRVFSDVFEYKDLRAAKGSQLHEVGRRKSESSTVTESTESRQQQTVDEEMWHALDKGRKLKTILDDFYSRVYKDERLSGFFENSTAQRSSEKQYLFMRQLFTGEKVYFGDRPKNAHHWMVISNELFDYRESLMAECLRDHNLPEHLVQRWIALDESFRKDIVKDKPWPKVINGVEMPLDGFEVMAIDVGTICDGCQQAIEAGEQVRYHVRLGLTYCSHCMSAETETKQAV